MPWVAAAPSLTLRVLQWMSRCDETIGALWRLRLPAQPLNSTCTSFLPAALLASKFKTSKRVVNAARARVRVSYRQGNSARSGIPLLCVLQSFNNGSIIFYCRCGTYSTFCG